MKLRRRQPADAAPVNAGVELIEAFTQGDRAALAHVDSLGVIEHVRYADVARKATRWAGVLSRHDVQPGDRVIVLTGPDRVWRTALLGVLHAGAVAVPAPSADPVAEIRAMAADAGAVAIVSAVARPDLVEPDGATVLVADELDQQDVVPHPPLAHDTAPEDAAVILYSRTASGMQSTVQTHASLLEQAALGENWLGVHEGERVWSTIREGSADSIRLLLAAWHTGAEIVVVEQTLDPETWLELLDRFRPAVVWFADEQYAALASTRAGTFVGPVSTRRALTMGEATAGATAFERAFGAKVARIPPRTAAVATERPTDDDKRVKREAEEAERAREAKRAEEKEKAETQRLREEAKSREAAERAADDERRRAEEVERVEREAAAAEERRLADEANKAAAATAQAEERRRGEEEKSRKAAERAAAEERRRAEEAQSAEREAAAAEQRRLADEAKKAAAATAKAEDRRRREEEKGRKAAERAAAEERRRAEKADRAEREAATAEQHRLAEEAKRAAAAEERRRREEEKTRKAAERAAVKARRLTEQTKRAERPAATADTGPTRGKAAESERTEREERRRRDAAEKAERERLAPDILSRISQYGVTTTQPRPRADESGEHRDARA